MSGALLDLVLRLVITLCGVVAAERIADRREYRRSFFAFVATSCLASGLVLVSDHTSNSYILAVGSLLMIAGSLAIALAFATEQVRKFLGLAVVLSLYLNIFVLVERLAEVLFTRAAEREMRLEFVALQFAAMIAVGAWTNTIARRLGIESGSSTNDRH